MLRSDLSLVEPWHITDYDVQLVGSIVLSGEVFRDYESQHLVHIWGRVLENLLEDQVQQCITAVSSAINKNSCLEENCSRTKKPCAAVLQSFSYFSLLLLIYTFSSFIIYFFKKPCKQIQILFACVCFQPFVWCLCVHIYFNLWGSNKRL